jgi:hypothetical protein
MVAKRKIAQDNPALMALGAALVSGAVEAGTSIAQKATGPGSPMSVDDTDGADGVSLFVKWAQQNLEPDEMRALGDALREAADAGDAAGGREKAAMDSAWGRNKPDSFSRRFPGSRRIGRPL